MLDRKSFCQAQYILKCVIKGVPTLLTKSRNNDWLYFSCNPIQGYLCVHLWAASGTTCTRWKACPDCLNMCVLWYHHVAYQTFQTIICRIITRGDDGLRPRNQTMQEFVCFFFFLFSKWIICNFSRQRKKIWHCVSTHGALTGGLRPDQHIFALLARFSSLGLHPPSSLKQKSTWRSIVLSQRSRAKAHVQVVKTELPSSDLKRVSSIVILLFTCVVLSSLLRLLSILCFSSLLS